MASCRICFESTPSDKRTIIECSDCGISVHPKCYGLSHFDGDQDGFSQHWLCSLCHFKHSFPRKSRRRLHFECILCGHGHDEIYGPLLHTECGRWAHPFCVISNFNRIKVRLEKFQINQFEAKSPDITMHRIRILDQGQVLNDNNYGVRECSICHSVNGVVQKCLSPQCTVNVHPICAAISCDFKSILIQSQSGSEPKVISLCNDHRDWIESNGLKPLKRNGINGLKSLNSSNRKHSKRNGINGMKRINGLKPLESDSNCSMQFETTPSVGPLVFGSKSEIDLNDDNLKFEAMEQDTATSSSSIEDLMDLDKSTMNNGMSIESGCGDGEQIKMSLDEKLQRVR